ncbi:MAG: hypothetical protein WCO58_01660 [bacterium]
MLENIWFKFVGLLPSVILFILIPLGIIWVAFRLLKPKLIDFWKTLGILAVVFFDSKYIDDNNK